MRTETRTIFKFDELPSEEAKENAREWWRAASGGDMPWADEWRASAEAFCDAFGVRLLDWSVGPFSPVDVSHNAENAHFRGRKLREFDPEYMPTGFCGDCDFWGEFHKEFKRTGDAKGAFDSAIWAGFYAWRADMEWQFSDEAVEETLIANEYEFDADGEII